MKKRWIFLSLLTLPIVGHPCTGTWQGPSGADWSLSGSWSSTPIGCVPQVSGDTAIFAGTGGPNVTLDIPVTLLNLEFNSTVGYVIQEPSPTTTSNSITFNQAGSTISLTASGNTTPAINVPVNINGNTTININTGSSSDSNLTFGTNNTTTVTGCTLTVQSVNATQTLAKIQWDIAPILNSGTLSNLNALNYTVTGTASFVTVNTSMTVGANSALSNTNTGNISVSNAAGVSMNIIENLAINGGSFSNLNQGPVSTLSRGATVIINLGMTVTSGSVQNLNTGDIHGSSGGLAGIGSIISIGSARSPSSLTITGGTVTNTNTGTVQSHAFGSLIQVDNTINIGSPGGTLENNDTVQTDTISITSGGTLSGTGTYTGLGTATTTIPSATVAVTNDGGNVNPITGSTPGTMTINGSYTQSTSPTTTGTLTIDFLNGSTFSKLNVNGTASIGGNLVVDFLPGSNVPGGTYTIAQATNLAGENFASVTYQNLPATLTPNPVQYTFGSNGTVVLSFNFQPLPPPSSSLPTTYAGGFIQTLLSDINHINSLITRRTEDLRRRFEASSQGTTLARGIRNDRSLIASAENRLLTFSSEIEEKQELLRREVAAPEKGRPWNFYFGPTGRAYGEIHNKDGDPGAHFWSVGGLMGFDYAFSEVGVGFMGNYERIFDHVKENWGRIDIDEFEANIYLTYAPHCLPELAINAIGGGEYQLYHIHRNVGTQVAKGNPNGFGYDALLGFEYVIGSCNLHFIPLVNAQYIYLRAESYDEKGTGSFDLRVDSQRIKSLRSSLGFRLNYYYENGDLLFIPEFYAEWQREYMNRRRGIGIEPIGGIGGSILVPGTGRNICLGGVDLLFTYKQRFGLEISYETEYNSLYHDHFFYLGANFRF